ncbi:MAG: GntR family transcriptional regulator [Bowdeniella nasicola]|nr:GntR family transcriptional regulator [Bowdeniella nasicola]
MNQPATPVAPSTQAGFAYDALKRKILSGALAGGERIHQSDWADRLNISITPVREAIRRLEQDGLVTSEAHRGSTVNRLTLAAAEEIYALRLAVEPLQIRRAVGKMTPRKSARAQFLCDEMATLTDVVLFTDYNQEFHKITMAHDNSWTAHTVAMLAAAAAPYVSLSVTLRPEQIYSSNRDHYQILEATLDEDVERVIELERNHVLSTLEILRESLEE